jgi:hypothetical protein
LKYELIQNVPRENEPTHHTRRCTAMPNFSCLTFHARETEYRDVH